MKTKEEVIEEFRIQSIREAATRVIARKGIAGASMQEIAAEAGIAKGTIYLYFRNQQELIEAAVDQALTELLTTLERALFSEGSFADRLKLLIRNHIEFFAQNADLFQIHLSTTYPGAADPESKQCDRTSRPQYQHYLDLLTRFLSEAIERGEVRSGDPRRIALFLEEGMIAVLFQRLAEKRPPSIEEEVEWISTMILSGIATPKKPRRRN